MTEATVVPRQRVSSSCLWVPALALQLHSRFDMSFACGGLVRTSPA